MSTSWRWSIGGLAATALIGGMIALATPDADRGLLWLIIITAAAVIAGLIAHSLVAPPITRWWGRRQARRRSERAARERQRMEAQHGAAMRAWDEFFAAARQVISVLRMMSERLLSIERWWPEYLSALDRASSLAGELPAADRQTAIAHLEQIQREIPSAARALSTVRTSGGRADVKRNMQPLPETSALLIANDHFDQWLGERCAVDWLTRYRRMGLTEPDRTKRVAPPKAEKVLLELDVGLDPLPQLWPAGDRDERRRIAEELDPLYAFVAVTNAGLKNLDGLVARVELPCAKKPSATWSKETGPEFIAGGSESAPLGVGQSRLLVAAQWIGRARAWGYVPSGRLGRFPFTSNNGELIYDPVGDVALGTEAEIGLVLESEGFEIHRTLLLRFAGGQPTIELAPITATDGLEGGAPA